MINRVRFFYKFKIFKNNQKEYDFFLYLFKAKNKLMFKIFLNISLIFSSKI
jgi:hypothetical protein